ncbi:hypothetical protein LTR36_006784 [Oleoguttula mirabilis]|uniref:F-box domain-containing protein n=1 Tax=Oleoguttula mirabilis TaxID=1507867 RepID=A0AAV9JBL0_9PEZI|nr:hypothetical protein LTR36_006784 [Oleoguttula mirabilis]
MSPSSFTTPRASPSTTTTTTDIATTLPPELWLEILPHIPYSPKAISTIRLTSVRLNSLLKTHEHTLVADIKRAQFGRQDNSQASSLALFPSLEVTTYAGLRTLHKRLQTLDELHSQWSSLINHCAAGELQWLAGRWQNVHKTGLLLLYRLQDSKTYEAKIALLNTLPATSLACLLFTLISSITILRVVGPAPMHRTYRQADVAARSDVELAFEEMLLGHGPGFFAAMLGGAGGGRRAGAAGDGAEAGWAISVLQAEIASMEDRQLPYPSGAAKPSTLIASLRRALAARAEVQLTQTVSKMWELLSGTAFDAVDQGKMVKLVRGEEIERGMRRMGF